MTQGRTTKEIGKSTRERLLRTAERLWAERGIDAVSVREITEEAEANTASIHYHFGSKAELIEAIFRYRADELGRIRGRYLAEIEQMDEPSLRQVIAAMVLPVAEMIEEKGGGQYIGFLVALSSHPELMHLLIQTFDPDTDRYLAALERVTPHLSEAERYFRFAVARELTSRLQGRPNGPVQQWLDEHRPGADANIAEKLINFLEAAFSETAAPRTASARPRRTGTLKARR